MRRRLPTGAGWLAKEAAPGARLAWLALALGLVLFSPAASRGADSVFNVSMATGADAEIRLVVPGGQAPLGGFLPVMVRIVNRAGEGRAWRLTLGNASVGGSGFSGLVRSVHAFAVPAASTREFYLFAPVAFSWGRGGIVVQGEIEGPQVDRSQFTLGLAYSWSAQGTPLAVEPAMESAVRAALTAPAPASPPPGGPIRRPGGRAFRPVSPASAMERVSVIDPAEWPADWRLWSSFGTVVLDEADWKKLDSPRRGALLDWVALGGRLVKFNGNAAHESHGAGEVVTVGGPLSPDAEALGVLDLRNFTRLADPGSALAGQAFWNLSPRAWQLGGKARWMTGFIIAFGLLIGPVNLFLLAPAGRRHRLFATVPFISVAGAGLLFGIITVSDGFGGEGTRRAVVILLPGQNQMAVFQRQICRTGLLGDRSFPLPADAIMELDGEPGLGSGEGPKLWRDGDTASGDWFASRATRQHLLRRLVPTRERIELVGAPGAAPVVQSTVTATLREFGFQDDAGRIWTASEVPPGVRVTLQPGSEPMLESTVLKYLPGLSAGQFYALGSGESGALIPTLPAIHWRDDVVLFTGRLATRAADLP